MNRLHQLTVAAIAALGVFAQSASAQPPASKLNAIERNCRTDFMALCARLKPGSNEGLACLGKHVERLSPACQEAMYATDEGQPEKTAERNAKPAPAVEETGTRRQAAIHSAPPPPARAAHQAAKYKHETNIAAAPVEIDERTSARSVQPSATHKQAAATREEIADEPPAPRGHASKTVSHSREVVIETSAKPKTKVASRSRTVVIETRTKPKRTAEIKTKPHYESAAAVIRTCHTDLARFCRSVRPGSGREFSCLANHRIFLSHNCRAAITVVGRAH